MRRHRRRRTTWLESVAGRAPAQRYGYDALGRTTSVVAGSGTTTLSYDFEGRATSITGPGVSQTNVYNGLDTRVGSTTNSVARTFLRDGATVTDPVLKDGAATYTPGVSERRGSTTTFSHAGLKSADAQSGTAQTVAATRQYDAFGNLTSSTGTWQGPFGYGGPFGYQEDATGLKLLGHRLYDSSTGRFLTRDPIKDGRNWYTYCENDPAANGDPDGQKLRLIGFTPEQEKKVRKHIRLIERSSRAGRQLIYDLVNDKDNHTISPLPKGEGPHYDPNHDRVHYDPNQRITLPGKARKGKPLPCPPDVILAHELGHMYGRPDPGGGEDGYPVGPGDTVHDFENPHRRTRKLPEREVY